MDAAVQENSKNAAQKTRLYVPKMAVSSALSDSCKGRSAHVRAHQLAPGGCMRCTLETAHDPGPYGNAK